MRVVVEGGTHLGIVGCYGRKEFEIRNPDELEKRIRKNRDLPTAKKSSYKHGTEIIHTLTDEKGATLFEYCVISGGESL